jgi:cytochrome c-type biogenesis protein CcsB
MKLLFKALPWFFFALFGCEIVAVMMPKKDHEFHVREFGRLPVLLNGRIQPFDSVARNSLLQIRSTGDVPLEQVPSWQFWHHPKKLKSTEWLLEVMTRPEVADTRPIFLIHHADVLGDLKLQDKGIEKSGLRYYSFNDLQPVLKEIEEQGQKASAVKAEEQTTFQKQVLKLANATRLYQRLKLTIEPEGADNFSQDLADFQRDLGPAKAAARVGENSPNFDKDAVARIARPVQIFQIMADYDYPLVVPPLSGPDSAAAQAASSRAAAEGTEMKANNPETSRAQWQTAGASLLASVGTGEIHPAMTRLAAIATAYHEQNPAAFNRAVASYHEWLQPRFPKELRKGAAEFYFNDVKAFLHATIIYIFAFILACVSILTYTVVPNFSESLRRSAFALVILAGVVHTFGLVFRMVLEGRPPVTNLYSSAIFIGWATMVLGIIIERIYRVGIGSLVASLAGFTTLLIAYNLAIGGDTMEMLRAVLDTNYWLATHVVVITLGYASTFFAGLLAILYIALGVFTPMLREKIGQRQAATMAASGAAVHGVTGHAAAGAVTAVTAKPAGDVTFGKALSKMVYGVVCFATLFSFVGTVLGGIWADQSWGRFWGWDPKENGALLIVLWNAIILHARWGGLVRDRGIMNLAVFGNIVTSFSWFGVNMLGIGLHSYGFMDAAFKWLMLFMASQAAIIAIGLLPLHLWRSFRTAAKPPASASLGGTPQPAVT